MVNLKFLLHFLRAAELPGRIDRVDKRRVESCAGFLERRTLRKKSPWDYEG